MPIEPPEAGPLVSEEMADNSHLKSLEEEDMHDEQGTGREITPETTPETETGRGAEEEGEAARWSLKTQGN